MSAHHLQQKEFQSPPPETEASPTINQQTLCSTQLDSTMKTIKALSEYAESVCWSDLPPCDDPNAIHIEVWGAQCHAYENVYKFNEWIPLLRPCSQSNICYRKYKRCWDFTQSPPRRVSIYLGSGVYGTPNCSATEPELPPNGRNWNEPWKTNCFQTCQY